jgi:hypothetical protein
MNARPDAPITADEVADWFERAGLRASADDPKAKKRTSTPKKSKPVITEIDIAEAARAFARRVEKTRLGIAFDTHPDILDAQKDLKPIREGAKALGENLRVLLRHKVFGGLLKNDARVIAVQAAMQDFHRALREFSTDAPPPSPGKQTQRWVSAADAWLAVLEERLPRDAISRKESSILHWAIKRVFHIKQKPKAIGRAVKTYREEKAQRR